MLAVRPITPHYVEVCGMSPSLESVCERLEAAIHAQNSAQSPAESALALLQLNAALTQALYQEPLAQPSLCLLYTSPSPRDRPRSRMPSSA